MTGSVSGSVVVTADSGARRYFSVKLFGGCLLALSLALLVVPASFSWIGRLWPSCATLFVAAVLVSLLRRFVYALRRDWIAGCAALLPGTQRADWLAERAAVLHACTSRAKRRRQALSFALSLPRTVLLSWTSR